MNRTKIELHEKKVEKLFENVRAAYDGDDLRWSGSSGLSRAFKEILNYVVALEDEIDKLKTPE